MSSIDKNDQWVPGAGIRADALLLKIKNVMRDCPVIVEHWFYRGATAPERMIFEEYDEFMEYLNSNMTAGDALHVWRFDTACRDENVLVSGKYPDDKGRIPKVGSY